MHYSLNIEHQLNVISLEIFHASRNKRPFGYRFLLIKESDQALS